jgi:hypothetical protein
MKNLGVFAANQPLYAERNIPTFPLSDNKVPALSNYQKIGLPASSKLALNHRFRSASGLGFMTNARTRIAVLDVDTTDERVLADAMIRHGSTPVVARTASGKFHAYYRHNGEHRKIRPFNNLPIDVLGDNGLVVAIPSRFEKGTYSFVQGSLDDLERLPVMRGLDADMYSRASKISAGAAALTDQEREAPVCEGRRDDTLWRYCMAMLAEFPNIGREALLAAAVVYNRSFLPPMSNAEVIEKVNSACDGTAKGRNFFGGKVVSTHAEVDDLGPDSFYLLNKLRRHNWGEKDFVVANAMAESMRWTIKRFAAAKAELERRGKIRCVRDRKGGCRAPTYTWG